jgi:hypothetical protein
MTSVRAPGACSPARAHRGAGALFGGVVAAVYALVLLALRPGYQPSADSPLVFRSAINEASIFAIDPRALPEPPEP